MEGVVQYFKYHAGKYLVAWNPKSSTENERHSVVIKHAKGEILVKQIAGALAKRIISIHKGTITAQSNTEQGTIFTITLPSIKLFAVN